MRLGLHALGIGAGADRAVIDAVASAADSCGFATLWAGEHVVMVDRSASRYPYADDGVIAIPAQADWLDPMIALSFAAAASSRIGVATGVLLLPEHNPVVVAKQAASLDRLSGGRLTLGVGVGWSREEFTALGVPFEHRAARTAEYVAAMRTLWRDDVASFDGKFVGFDSIRVNPRPVLRSSYPGCGRRQQRPGTAARSGVGRRLVRVQPRRRGGGARADRQAGAGVCRLGA
jgi:probable F420-dependent oxidoreductase